MSKAQNNPALAGFLQAAQQNRAVRGVDAQEIREVALEPEPANLVEVPVEPERLSSLSLEKVEVAPLASQNGKSAPKKEKNVAALAVEKEEVAADEYEERRRLWYGTIDEEYVRKRDGIATRKRNFTLSIDLISRLEVFCANPKRSTNMAAEEAISQWLDRQERRR